LCQVKIELEKKWPENRTINIVAFGDSVPAGYAKVPMIQTQHAYPRVLSDYLSKKYPTAVINVITSAVGGENSTSGVKRFESDALSYKPVMVIIDYGLNDRFTPAVDVKNNLTTMIELSRKAGALPVLVTPNIDLAGDPPNAFTTLSQQAELIREIAKSKGVLLADAYIEFIQYKGDVKELMAQSNHPNENGHKLIAKRITRLFESNKKCLYTEKSN